MFYSCKNLFREYARVKVKLLAITEECFFLSHHKLTVRRHKFSQGKKEKRWTTERPMDDVTFNNNASFS